VQAQIKSGTNGFHGGAFEFLRNDKLDANNFFNNLSGTPRTPYKQNQFGAFLGGPIIKNKMFFFVDTELLRTREDDTGIITIPTPLQRQGIFTESGQPTIYNPVTGLPFPNNTIPASLQDSAAAKIMALAKWERGEREPTGALLSRVKRFLDEEEESRHAAPCTNKFSLHEPGKPASVFRTRQRKRLGVRDAVHNQHRPEIV
jgi:hypothetical protein